MAYGIVNVPGVTEAELEKLRREIPSGRLKTLWKGNSTVSGVICSSQSLLDNLKSPSWLIIGGFTANTVVTKAKTPVTLLIPLYLMYGDYYFYSCVAEYTADTSSENRISVYCEINNENLTVKAAGHSAEITFTQICLLSCDEDEGE